MPGALFPLSLWQQSFHLLQNLGRFSGPVLRLARILFEVAQPELCPRLAERVIRKLGGIFNELPGALTNRTAVDVDLMHLIVRAGSALGDHRGLVLAINAGRSSRAGH